jgi:hypothetical protein
MKNKKSQFHRDIQVIGLKFIRKDVVLAGAVKVPYLYMEGIRE